jgi:hypothetical protein
MPLGVTVTNQTAPPSRGTPTDTDTLFVGGVVDVGTTTVATKVRSILEFEAQYGPRDVANALLYDLVDSFFREGGRQAYIGGRAGAGTIANSLALFPKSLGPGQVADAHAAGGAATFGALLDHAQANNRFAVMDVATGDTTAAQLQAKGALVPVQNVTYGMLVGPWLTIPAPSSVVGGAQRSVPASGVAAALIARSDALGNVNRAAAGRDFPLQYVLTTPTYTDAELDATLNAGANAFTNRYGVLQLYGFQTKLAQTTDTPFWQANCGRARMWLTAQAAEVGENYMFKPIDGKGHLQQALKTDLDAIAGQLYAVDGLYGNIAAEAYATNVGVTLNPEASVAQGILHAAMEVRLTPHAKTVNIDLVSVPVTGRVTA